MSTGLSSQILYIGLSTCTGGNRTMVAAATIVIMAAAKKAQQNVFALHHSYNRTILLKLPVYTTATTWETLIRIWTTCLFLDANIAGCPVLC